MAAMTGLVADSGPRISSLIATSIFNLAVAVPAALAVPAGPDVSASDDVVGPGAVLVIRWDPVTEKATDPAGGVFPDVAIDVVAYQIIVGSFQVTLPAADPPSPMSVTVPPEFVEALESGQHGFEVLAIDVSGNQTITAGAFTK
jgi:hypothetical protein